ncbi:TetR/AcrR family transcriptional regulator [Patulibacter sp.]|uniref:TetR/AcrR family transcriptional regulator n=1 Tax=Patulibacter sp. TaxID=1912859 RepID=UPI002722B1F1|nr:TetR/AcrR family transcriptional regulator [Patulibacter sp.]MDO9406950.1 TetR/AcrR family transcriptional regulator [Patulibacter sp.]
MTAPSSDPRRRILDGLAASLRERGLAHTQIDDIVRHARMSKRTFYATFPDKESAFVELIREGSIETFDAVARLVGGDLPWEEQVELGVTAYLRALDDNPLLVAAISRDLPGLGPRGIALHREALDRFAGLFTEMSRSFAGSGAAVRPIPQLSAVLLVAGVAELVARAALDHGPMEDLAPVIVDAIVAFAQPRREPASGA